MCIIALAYKTPALGPLVLLANRDEYYTRPALPLDFWTDYPQILGGRDVQAGGSWMAIDTRGRFAAVTHIREGRAVAAARSRGELVQRFVSGDDSALAYAAWLKAHTGDYGPFNLVFGQVNDLLHFNSRTKSLNRIAPGIHVLSNADMDTRWFKAEQLRQKMTTLKRPPADSEVLPWLMNPESAPPEQLPNTGIGSALEKMLSPVFIVGRDYGTRCSSIVNVSARGDVSFTEVSYGIGGRESGRRRHQLRIGQLRKTL
ncbi:NRDE family protein [Vogesella sp. DC21W]|uniref:NRDE family protein n=1 Tax=Vogesella aquatica TaxID=2984206 RepID=A0ABT5IUV4_9NEIS|nr:NRDE family protein [Vogesella aquatica]MDC7716347.1 NRDE family protein [Vogesella aquatica]